MAIQKFLNLEGLSVFLDNLRNTFSPSKHTHTKSEITDLTVDSSLSATSTNPVQNSTVTAALDAKVPTTRTINGKSLSSNISLSPADVGADPTGTASSAVATHNTTTDAHNDIRLLVSELSTQLNNFLNVDDTTKDQLSEVIAMIEANEGTIESLTSGKVNVTDIINNLTTNVSDKPLSAAQGVALKALIDELRAALETVHVQADLSVNDPTDPAYVKNRTHWDNSVVIHNSTVPTKDYEWIKISDLTPTEGELMGAVITIHHETSTIGAQTEYITSITRSGVIEEGITAFLGEDNSVYVASTLIFVLSVSVPEIGEPGIYFRSEKPDTWLTELKYGNIHPLDEKFLPESVKVQPDLSVNDENDPRYVKGRTHYVGDPVETELIPEQTVAFEVFDVIGQAASPVAIEPVEGQSYTVNFDGVTYQCVCKMLNGAYLYIGSPTAFGLEDTGEPFIYLYDNGQSAWVAYNADTEHVLSMTTIATEIVKIPDKFLPDYDFAGKNVSNKTIMGYDDNEYVGGMYAEIFNDLTNKASGYCSHAEGLETTASGDESHAEGQETTASGDESHAEGYLTTASGYYSHAEGHTTTASGYDSHAEGLYSTASNDHSHAEGYRTTASGSASHAEGYNTTASADYSHAEGYYTNAGSSYQHVQGKCNIEDTNNKYAHIVGNGTSSFACSNAHTIDWNGLGWFAGGLKVGGTGQDDTNAVEVATLANAEEWVFTLEDGSTVTKKVVLG